MNGTLMGNRAKVARMNAGAKGWTRSVLILAAVFLVLAVPIRAQDETEAEDDAVTGVGDWIVGYEAWDVQPAGLGFVAATVEDPLNPFDTEVQPVAFDAELRGRWKVGYVFPKRMGSLVLTWFSRVFSRTVPVRRAEHHSGIRRRVR